VADLAAVARVAILPSVAHLVSTPAAIRVRAGFPAAAVAAIQERGGRAGDAALDQARDEARPGEQDCRARDGSPGGFLDGLPDREQGGLLQDEPRARGESLQVEEQGRRVRRSLAD